MKKKSLLLLLAVFAACFLGSVYWARQTRFRRPLVEARFAYARGNFSLALAWTNYFRSRDPFDSEARRLEARCLARLGDPERALQIYSELPLSEAEDIFLVGVANARLKRNKLAFEQLKAALALDPTLSEARRWLIVIYNEAGGIDKAIEEAKILAEDESLGDERWRMLGELYFAYREYGKAKEAYEKIPNLEEKPKSKPEYRILLRNYLECLIQAKELDRASQILVSLGNISRDAHAMGLKARFHELKGDRESAERDWRDACRIDPKNSRSHLGFGEFLYEQKRDAEALEHLKIAVQLDPDNPYAHQLLAFVYRRLGDAGSADFHTRRTRELRTKG